MGFREVVLRGLHSQVCKNRCGRGTPFWDSNVSSERYCPHKCRMGQGEGDGMEGAMTLSSSSRSSEHENAYENVPEEEGRMRSTPM